MNELTRITSFDSSIIDSFISSLDKTLNEENILYKVSQKKN